MILDDDIARPSETPREKSRRIAGEKVRFQLQEESRTASHKLTRKIFFSLLYETGRDTCCRCNVTLTEHTYSIDHMENWLDSQDPRGLFFDIKNIDFSCKKCNTSNNRGLFKKGGGRLKEEQPPVPLMARKPLSASHATQAIPAKKSSIGRVFSKIKRIFKRK